jgi:signal transduction histidine kinase
VALLLAAVLVPAGVLVTLAVRLVRQEAELAEKRRADERRAATEQLRRELAARLDAVRLEAANRLAAQGAAVVRRRTGDSPVVFTAAIEQNRLVPPWSEAAVPGGDTPPAFLELERQGEAQEYQGNDPTAAAALYRRALASGRTPLDRCRAQLRLGRALTKAAQWSDAIDAYRRMLTACEHATDADGVSYGLYAAERLVSSGLDPDAGRTYVLARAKAPDWRAPTEAYLMRALLTGVDTPEAAAALTSLSREIEEGEAILALGADVQRFRRLDGALHVGGAPDWVAYGPEPWFLTVISSDLLQARPALLAVSSARVLPPGVRLLTDHRGLPLGDGFPGLSVEWPPGRAGLAGGVPPWVWLLGISMIVGLTFVFAYLLIRDVNRDVQLAEMRARFVSSVSHELKTPLTSIRMFAETLALGRQASGEARTEYLQTIVNESERLSRLVDNVLDFTRIEEGRRIYQMQRVAPADVVYSAARAIQYPLAQQGFHLRVDVDDGLPVLTADADALEQALLNLIANAMKYSGESRDIALRLLRRDGDASIEVSDGGIGIPEHEQERIFEKYYRVQSAETARIPGAGLGLTLVRHAVAAHGGRLLVSSALGRGSTFTMRIPFAREGGAV